MPKDDHLTAHSEPPDASEIKAWETLLDDEDEQVFGALKERILGFGDSVRPWLDDFRINASGLAKKNCDRIRLIQLQSESEASFLAYCLLPEDDFDLETAIWKFTATRYPEVREETYRKQLDQYAEIVRSRLNQTDSGHFKLRQLNTVLFEELGFKGNTDDYYDPSNSYLNEVINKRTGLPISLSLIYLFVAARVNIPVKGVAMPGHFLCRYETDHNIHFIDPFNQGQILSKTDCAQFLNRHYGEYRETFLNPSPKKQIVQRVCANLHHYYSSHDDPEIADRLRRYMVALEKDVSHQR